jgi:TRAP-type C4-dicarboxylate transport system permease small subunit
MIQALDKLSEILNRTLTWLASVLLGAMVLITSANIILRVFGKPVGGTVEIMAYTSALVTAFALGYTQIEKSNIPVDFLFQKFPNWLRMVFTCVNCSLVGAFFCVVGWQVAKYAGTLKQTGEISETLGIIYYPFTYGVAFGCFVLALVIIVDLLKAVSGREEGL